MAIRQATCRLLDRALRQRLAPFARDDWTASAVIIAPHPDDETLGCGGVACKKIAAGAEVRFVFVTDGAASHVRQVGAEALRRMRAREALDAAARLGAGADQVAFLEVPDGRAADYVPEIARQLSTLLHAWRPESVYVVHAGDPPSDHRAAHLGVSAAIRSYGRRLQVFEYPVWFWYHWPWVDFGRRPSRDVAEERGADGAHRRRATLAQPAQRDGRRLRCLGGEATCLGRAPVADRTAGQPARTGRSSGILGRGDFLARLMSDYEAFMRYEVNA